ncbi:B-cell receptor CD22 isoform X5 [Ctenopharyngodon idella]|uniref:B-cell receptor CD22 isoform X3 n=1 Tax=Ctenopharyngodon idella TaxID=7959 RepID=UPI00223122E4|nr:B-cell receptor CD22 isoform X3 [Ctenopharyngodon idella]XP_051747246.1 B-cell receptor CD22 isoform X3 [Ctenopharyngodon idella]XP_051747248.1 B-cell receptor CD22 isoform X5 [Ctenopharyngodon idella]
MYMMEISVTFLLTGCLIQGVFCGFSISLPERVEALEGSCVFIPCRFYIEQEYENDLNNNTKRIWYKDGTPHTVVFDSSHPDTGPLRGEIFGTPTEKNCTTRFSNLSQSNKGSYFFRIETNGRLKLNYKKPLYSQVEIAVTESPPKPTVSLLKDQQEVMEVTEGSSVNLRCSTKIFCSSRPAVLTWSSSPEHLLKENVTQQHQNETDLISDLIFTVTHHHHSATFTCTVTHQLQQQITKSQNESRTLRVQYAPKNTSAHVNPSGFVLEGRSVTLSCSSDANPPELNYTWYRDTEEPLKPVQTGQNLTINNTNPTHSGRYVCTAQNKHGAQNASVLLDVQYAPKNTSAHVNPSGFVLEGRSVTLSCSSDANPPELKYTWYRDTEEPLKPVQTGQNLTINNTNPTHSGRYVCTAQNKHGAQNASVQLDVQYAPKNTSAHVNPSGFVLEGRSVTLSCSSDANPPELKYTWYRDTEEPLKPVQTGQNLTINNTNPTHSGRYVCTAQNKHGAQNASVQLDVQYAPKNTSAHVNPSGFVLEGRSVTLSCSSDANPPELKYTWYRDTEEPLKPVQTGQNLTINNTNPTHSGRYVCTAQNKHGAQNASVELDVQYAPKNTSAHVNPSGFVLEGRSVTLSCSSDANPPELKYTWYRDTEEPLKPVQTGQNLTINNTNPTHSGQYVCTAQNKHGAQNASVLLDVQYAPKNTSAHVNPSGFVLEGRSVTLSCSSDANPPELNYTWYRDTEEPLKPVQTGQNLTINNTNPTHSGRYVCTAQNKHGAQNASVLLDVQFAPKISISCNQSSEITCVCEAHGNPSPTLKWHLSGNVLANSTNTSISNETPGNTSLKSVLINYQPLTNTAVLQCFSANTHGTASISQKFHPVTTTTPKTETETRFHHPSMLLGAAVGALAMMILCIMKICYERRRNPKASGTRQDDRSGLILTQIATASDGDGECVYAVTHKPPESPHYSSIDFTNAEPPSGEIRGVSSLTEEYAVVRHRSAKDAASATDPKKDQSPPDSRAKITDVSSEDTIYENMSRRLVA